MPLLDTAARGAVTLGGRALGVAFGAVTSLRSADKPLHPVGSVVTGTLRRVGGSRRSGVAWLDEPGEDEVLVRLSRSVGLPAPSPDIFGLAVRVPGADAGDDYGDLLFSGSGTGPLSRFVFLPGRSIATSPQGTVLPYRTPAGPVVLLATPRDASTFDLSWAVGRGAWTRFATLELGTGAPAAPDTSISFDPVRNTVPGLEIYPWVRRLREPSYRSARRARGLPD